MQTKKEKSYKECLFELNKKVSKRKRNAIENEILEQSFFDNYVYLSLKQYLILKGICRQTFYNNLNKFENQIKKVNGRIFIKIKNNEKYYINNNNQLSKIA